MSLKDVPVRARLRARKRLAIWPAFFAPPDVVYPPALPSRGIFRPIGRRAHRRCEVPLVGAAGVNRLGLRNKGMAIWTARLSLRSGRPNSQPFSRPRGVPISSATGGAFAGPHRQRAGRGPFFVARAPRSVAAGERIFRRRCRKS